MDKFTNLLTNVREGHLLEECDEELKALIHKVHETGKDGSISVTITIKDNGFGCIRLSDKITIKLPADKKGETILFVTADGRTSRNNPSQLSMEELKTPARPPSNRFVAGVPTSITLHAASEEN